MTFSVFVFSLLAGKVLFKTFSEKQKIFLLNYLFSLPGMTAEEVSSLGETITVHSMCFQDRRLTPITSRYEGMWDKCHGNDKNVIIRWRMSAVLGTMRRGASSSPATPLTRWTRSPVSSATTKWSFLKGEEEMLFHSFFIPSFPLQISAHWRDVLHLPPAAHACLYPGQGGGPHQLPVRGLHGLPGGLDLQTPVQEQQLHQGLGRLTAHPRHHVQLRHLRRGPLLCREIEGRSGVMSGLWQVGVEYFSHCVCYQCTSCGQLVIHPEQRFNFFSDYSQTVSCPQCGVQDFHFVKPLKHSFLTKDDITRMNGINSNPVGLSSQMSWARITANS